MEPNTSGAGLAAWKAIGGLAGMGALGAGLASVVVMCLLRPRTGAEWAVGLISTVMGSIGGGAAVIMHFDLVHWAQHPIGLVALLGLTFACGLPAWAFVRWGFNYFDQRRNAHVLAVIQEARRFAAGGGE